MVKSYTIGQILQFAGWAGIAWKVFVGVSGYVYLVTSSDSSIAGYGLFLLMEELVFALPFVLLLLAGKWVRRRELVRSAPPA